jgi:hypothetical protein
MPSVASPRGVVATTAFFVVAGVLETALALWDGPRPIPPGSLWTAVGRGLLHLLLAWGLWRRIALCRSLAMVYCLAVLITYGFVLALAFAQAPVPIPASVVLKSLYEVPSCAVMLPYLRSAQASLAFRG